MDLALHTILIISVVGSAGLFLGHIKVGGVKIGIAGVLFAGVLAGHFGAHVPAELIDFLRDFGLIIFVYLIGIQVGPGFASTLKNEGRLLVPLCIAIVVLGTAISACLALFLGLPPAVALGILSGATTNTPSLAAAQESLGAAAAEQLGIGYAISYPGAILGLIATMTILRIFFRIDPHEENQRLSNGKHPQRELLTWSIRVENPNLDKLALEKLPGLKDLGVVISRIQTQSGLQLATPKTIIRLGDTLLVVGSPEALEQATLIVGKKSADDLATKPSNLIVRNLTVTHTAALGKKLSELTSGDWGSIRVTRIRRGDVEFTAAGDLPLRRGDRLRVVGEEEQINKLGKILGNAPQALETFNFLPLFVGMALGTIVGLYEIHIPGLPSAIKLGLAGGPLITALILSRFVHSKIFPTYVPYGASIALRELGMTLFLTAVGLKAGPRFFDALFSPDGLRYVICGAIVTVAPLIAVLFLARKRANVNYLLLCGTAAGSLTDPPALAFANTVVPDSNGPSVAYATVYPVAMILRILFIQLLALWLIP